MPPKRKNELAHNHNIVPGSTASDNQQGNGMSFTMIFASILGSFIGIALISRMFGPRRVEVVHKRQSDGAEIYPPPGPYRSV